MFMDTYCMPDLTVPCVPMDDVYCILLEGWRVSSLLLDRSVPGFSWRSSLLAFVQTDVLHRGWLDPHQVQEAERTRLQLSEQTTNSLKFLERTSIGAFVLRSVHHSSNLEMSAEKTKPLPSVSKPTQLRKQARLASLEAALQAAQAMFESLEKPLGVYLTWLMHSEELRDVSAYSALKGQIYGFQQAAKRSDARFSVHHVRCVLLLLLAHQFDVQLQREEVYPEQLHKEFQFFNEVLRENWIRATESTDLDFGCSLDSGSPESGGQERTFITSQP